MPKISEPDLAFMRHYVADNYWKPAKRGPNHQYTVREWRPEEDHNFVRFVRLIRTYGHPENFYSKRYIYFALDGLKYWTMGSPIPETIIINRAPVYTYYGNQDNVPTNDTYSETIYDQLASIYDERYQDEKSLGENEVIFGMLAGMITEKANSKILDIGCGTGILLEHLPIKPENYLGVDPSQGMMNEFIRKFPKYQFQQATYEEIKSNLHEFDIAVSLFGAPSYIDPADYMDLTKSATRYFLMFYKDGYLPDYYMDNPTKTDYQAVDLFFDKTIEFSNYLIATNMID